MSDELLQARSIQTDHFEICTPISFAIALVIYLILQRPAYRLAFIDTGVTAEGGWLVALAFGKLLYAMLLYTVFFVPMRTTAALSLFEWAKLRSIGQAIPSRLRPAGGILIGVLVKFGTDLAAKWLEHLWHGTGSPPVS